MQWMRVSHADNSGDLNSTAVCLFRLKQSIGVKKKFQKLDIIKISSQWLMVRIRLNSVTVSPLSHLVGVQQNANTD